MGAAADTRKRCLRDGPGVVRPRRERRDEAERSRLSPWRGFPSDATAIGWLVVRAHTSDPDSAVVRRRIPARCGRVYLRGRNELGGAGTHRRSQRALRPTGWRRESLPPKGRFPASLVPRYFVTDSAWSRGRNPETTHRTELVSSRKRSACGSGIAAQAKMLIGVPREIKVLEYRVGLTPDSVREFAVHGHKVVVETGAGAGIGRLDEDYRTAGAEIVGDAKAVFDRAEMIVKVKEPQASERRMLRDGQILFTYLHLAADAEQCKDLVASGATCIAYETVTDGKGGLPLLAPMSQVAGRLSIQAGAHCLERAHGGKGILLGGVPGVAPAKVVVIGGGVVGANAIMMALGMGADVTVLDRNVDVLRGLVHI